jgi:hypothetical protein
MGGDAMTFLERLETLGEKLLHPHHEDVSAEERQMREAEERHEHRVDQSAGSEFLDMM